MLKRIISATLFCLCMAVISYGQDGRLLDREPWRETPCCCYRCCETDPLLERERQRLQPPPSSFEHPEYIRSHEQQLRCRLCPQTLPSQPLQQSPPEDVRDFWWRRGSEGPANRGHDPL